MSFRILIASRKKTLVAMASDSEGESGSATVVGAETLERAKQILDSQVIDLVIVDLLMESRRGIELVLAIRHAFPSMFVVAVTDMQLRDYDREAIKIGVDGFLVHPVSREQLYFQIARCRELLRVRREYIRLEAETSRTPPFGEIVGTTSEMREIYQLVSRAAESQVPVAIYGESGTGKELVARAVHRNSTRSAGPFISLNPASIPETLLEAELFGHVRGAFTGAVERTGYIEAAEGGTLFLDEIGELPLGLQVKLLRVLQEKQIQRVGSSKPVQVNFRLITATNRDLMAEVKRGRFREDLFYRIHVFPIYLPPLRSRRRDIPLLAEHFLVRFAAELGREVIGFSPQALEILARHDWPGNVRELENYVHRVVALKKYGSLIEVEDLVGMQDRTHASLPQANPNPVPTFSVKPLAEHVGDYVRWAYAALDRNKARTARELEIDRVTLYRKLRQAGERD